METDKKRINKKKIILRVINVIIVVGFGAYLVYYLLGKISIGQIRDAKLF